MMFLVLLVYGGFLLCKDCFNALRNSISNIANNSPKQQNNIIKKDNNLISHKQLLTFEELLEDDE